MRVAFVLRSVEVQPLFQDLCKTQPNCCSCQPFSPSPSFLSPSFLSPSLSSPFLFIPKHLVLLVKNTVKAVSSHLCQEQARSFPPFLRLFFISLPSLLYHGCALTRQRHWPGLQKRSWLDWLECRKKKEINMVKRRKRSRWKLFPPVYILAVQKTKATEETFKQPSPRKNYIPV